MTEVGHLCISEKAMDLGKIFVGNHTLFLELESVALFIVQMRNESKLQNVIVAHTLHTVIR